jgi:hypothetical protein
MQAAWEGDLEAIKKEKFTFKDVKEQHGKPGEKKMHAFELAKKGYDAMDLLLHKNLIQWLKDFNGDEVVDHIERCFEQRALLGKLEFKSLEWDVALSDFCSLFSEFKTMIGVLRKNLGMRREYYIGQLERYKNNPNLEANDFREQSFIVFQKATLEKILDDSQKVLVSIADFKTFYDDYVELENERKKYEDILKIFGRKPLEERGIVVA